MQLWRKNVSGSLSGILMKAALDYGRLGWSVIPLQPRGKESLVNLQVYRCRRTDPVEIAEWFRHWPDANLAVVTGVVSGLVVVDIGPQQGADAGLQRLEQEHGPLGISVEARTGGGGRHLYFAHPGNIVPSRIGIAPGIDLHGDGGYVVAPPSVHACGESYRWERSPDVCRLAPLPESLLLAASEDEGHGAKPPSHWRHLLGAGVAEEKRNNSIATLADYLFRQGVDRDVAIELLLGWNAMRCHPPLEPEEVVRMLESATHRDPRTDDEGD